MGGQVWVKDSDLIFTLELVAALSASWSLEGALPGASVVVLAGDDSAAQMIAEGGYTQSFINHLVVVFWLLAARESLSIWSQRVIPIE